MTISYAEVWGDGGSSGSCRLTLSGSRDDDVEMFNLDHKVIVKKSAPSAKRSIARFFDLKLWIEVNW